ncbi:MAG: hypothetical protein WCK61_04885 [Candidatus Omnitrophota bacterium]
MNLEECRNTYYDYSRKASEIVRYLGFAGIALVWIFRTENNGVIAVPVKLLFPSILLIVGLALDLLHAVTGTMTWAIYNRYKEYSGTKETDRFKAPAWINWGTLFFFWTKIVVIIWAYALLLSFLFYKFCVSN